MVDDIVSAFIYTSTIWAGLECLGDVLDIKNISIKDMLGPLLVSSAASSCCCKKKTYTLRILNLTQGIHVNLLGFPNTFTSIRTIPTSLSITSLLGFLGRLEMTDRTE
jgi:hypothetical protein